MLQKRADFKSIKIKVHTKKGQKIYQNVKQWASLYTKIMADFLFTFLYFLNLAELMHYY